MPKTKKTTWIVTTSGDRPISAIAKEVAKAGLSVDQVLKEVGSIIGTGTPSAVRKVRAISGVVDVSRDTSFSIEPPDSSIM